MITGPAIETRSSAPFLHTQPRPGWHRVHAAEKCADHFSGALAIFLAYGLFVSIGQGGTRRWPDSSSCSPGWGVSAASSRRGKAGSRDKGDLF